MQYILQMIAAQLPGCLIFVYSYSQDENWLEFVGEQKTRADLSDDERAAVNDIIRREIHRYSHISGPEILTGRKLAVTDFQSALMIPMTMPDEVIGVMAVFDRQPHNFNLDQLDDIAPLVDMVRTLLENIHLYAVVAQHLAVAQSILLLAKSIADNASYQDVVDLLHNYLLGPHITLCVLMLYGPIQEEGAESPFKYLSVKGMWSKRSGAQIGLGMNFSLSDYEDLLARVAEEKIVPFTHANLTIRRFDPLIRLFLRAEHVRSMAFIGLHAAGRKLGVVFLGTENRHEFTTPEIDRYRTVGEFLAFSVMTRVLQQEQQRVQQGRAALLDAVTDGVVMVLPVPKKEGGEVLTVNQRFSSMFAVVESRAQGLSLIELLDGMRIPEDLREELSRTWKAIVVQDPSSVRGEFSMVDGEGARTDIQWYSAPVYREGSVLGRIYIFHNVTAERAAARLRYAFLSRVSHELRTPLTSISGFAQFILEATGDKLPDLAREYTEIILSSAKHLNGLFTDIIDLTRAETGEMKLDREEIHLPDVIIDGVAQMELQYKQRGQQVVMELDDDMPPIYADVRRLKQVMINLLGNAIKYAPPNTTITISTRFVKTVKQLPAGAPRDVVLPAILVTVADQGKGLSAEEVEQVFLPFFRTDDAKARKIEGVGLGLAVTRSIVEMHQGKIWAVPREREPRKRGRGGSFLFIIPTVRR